MVPKHERNIEEHTRILHKVNEVEPKKGGKPDVNQAVLNIPVNDHNNYCLNPTGCYGNQARV